MIVSFMAVVSTIKIHKLSTVTMIAWFWKHKHLIALFLKSTKQLSLKCYGNEVYKIWIMANVQTNLKIRYANTFYQLFAENNHLQHGYLRFPSRLEFCAVFCLYFIQTTFEHTIYGFATFHVDINEKLSVFVVEQLFVNGNRAIFGKLKFHWVRFRTIGLW